MPIRSAEEYREEARRVRALAETIRTPEAQATLLGVAADYETLAEFVDAFTRYKTPEAPKL
jgi:hypothetical protein